MEKWKDDGWGYLSELCVEQSVFVSLVVMAFRKSNHKELEEGTKDTKFKVSLKKWK